jgi:hypothetical protein
VVSIDGHHQPSGDDSMEEIDTREKEIAISVPKKRMSMYMFQNMLPKHIETDVEGNVSIETEASITLGEDSDVVGATATDDAPVVPLFEHYLVIGVPVDVSRHFIAWELYVHSLYSSGRPGSVKSNTPKTGKCVKSLDEQAWEFFGIDATPQRGAQQSSLHDRQTIRHCPAAQQLHVFQAVKPRYG